MRVTYDRQANAVYIQLTDEALTPGRTTLRADPPGVEAFIALDWKDDRLVGIEVLDAAPTSQQTSSSRPKPSARHHPTAPLDRAVRRALAR